MDRAAKKDEGKSDKNFVQFMTSSGKKDMKKAASNPTFSLNKNFPKKYINTIPPIDVIKTSINEVISFTPKIE